MLFTCIFRHLKHQGFEKNWFNSVKIKIFSGLRSSIPQHSKFSANKFLIFFPKKVDSEKIYCFFFKESFLIFLKIEPNNFQLKFIKQKNIDARRNSFYFKKCKKLALILKNFNKRFYCCFFLLLFLLVFSLLIAFVRYYIFVLIVFIHLTNVPYTDCLFQGLHFFAIVPRVLGIWGRLF